MNTLAPSWTKTGFLPPPVIASVGIDPQEPILVGRAAAYLMADETRAGQMLHVANGVYREIEEAILLPAAEEVVDVKNGGIMEDDTLAAIIKAMNPFGAKKN